MTREEAIEWINYHIDISDYDEDDDWLTALKMAVKALKKQKTGQWISNRHTDTVLCSECDKCYGDEYNFCPNCGARMLGEDENDD